MPGNRHRKVPPPRLPAVEARNAGPPKPIWARARPELMAAHVGAPPSRGGRASAVVADSRSPPGAMAPPRRHAAGARHHRRTRMERSPPPSPGLCLMGSLAAARRGEMGTGEEKAGGGSRQRGTGEEEADSGSWGRGALGLGFPSTRRCG
jgi:hypothetical protein